MIFDDLRNAPLYLGLGPRFAQALEFLQRTKLDQLELGEHDIIGRDVYAIVVEYEGKAQEQGLWEAHRHYADVQFVVSGQERMGFAQSSSMRVSKTYDEEKDYLLFEGDGSFLELKAGAFCIFFPDDVHMPGLKSSAEGMIRKVVVKVRL